MLDFSVKDLGIVPLYACNLNCDFCLFSHHRFEKSVLLSIEFLRKVLLILKGEGNRIKSVTIFGGEVSLLPFDYVLSIVESIYQIFPDCFVGIVSNLLEFKESYWKPFIERGVKISTSYDDFRFKSKDKKSLQKIWLKNFKRLCDLTGYSPLILVADSPDVEEIFSFLKELGVKEISPLRLYVPEEAPDKVRRKLLRFTLPPEHFAKTCKLASRYFEIVHLPNENGVSIVNTLLILPENRVVIHGASPLGYPFEKFYYIYPDSEDGITFSSKRLRYIADFLGASVCQSCEIPLECCLAEIRYPNLCTGKEVCS
ncbi:MAG: radical SAM protein [Caldisericum sp.]